MTLAAIFQDLELLNDFQTIGCGGQFVFENEGKVLLRRRFAGQDFPLAVCTLLSPKTNNNRVPTSLKILEKLLHEFSKSFKVLAFGQNE